MQRGLRSGLLAILGAGAILSGTLFETGCKKEEDQKAQVQSNMWKKASPTEKPQTAPITEDSVKQQKPSNSQRFYFSGNWQEPDSSRISPFGVEGKVYSSYGASKDNTEKTKLTIRGDTGIALNRITLATGEEIRYSYAAYIISNEPLSFQNKQIKDVTKEEAKRLEDAFYIGNPKEIRRKLFVYEIGKSKSDTGTRDSISFNIREECNTARRNSPVGDIETRLIVDYELKRGEQIQRITTTASPQVGIPPYIPELIGEWRANEGNMTLNFKEYNVIIEGDTQTIYGSKELILHKGKIYLEGTENGPVLEFKITNPPKMKYFPRKGSSEKPTELVRQ